MAGIIATPSQGPTHWRDLYATDVHKWGHFVQADGRNVWFRRLGLVENLFDTDGKDFEGRADMNPNLYAEVNTTLDSAGLKERITIAWALMRNRHILMSCKSIFGDDILPAVNETAQRKWTDRFFVHTAPLSRNQAIDEARKHIIFVGDVYPDVRGEDFYKHLMNTSRSVDPSQALSKLFVLLFRQTESSTINLHFIFVIAHEIADGLALYRWMTHFLDILNLGQEQIMASLESICMDTKVVEQRLPPAQETLYPPLPASPARLRWKWAISRILRHVHHAPPAAFQNPLRRDVQPSRAAPMASKYPIVLDYSRTPPLNSFVVNASLSPRITQKLVGLCREAGISIGSGCFALVAIVMMTLEERRHPNVAVEKRLPFVGSFPLNPRPFLDGEATTGKEDSTMLAFSEGITIPFLPTHLNLQRRFKILGRAAHRQLRQYQKRARSAEEELRLGSRGVGELFPSMHLGTIDKLETRVKPQERHGWNPQGGYPARRSGALATCGVSSIGDRTGLMSVGKYDVRNIGQKDLVADMRDLRSSVRARDGEFLVGAVGDKNGISFPVSYDGSTIDPKKVEEWKALMEGILDDTHEPGRSAAEPSRAARL